MTNHQKLTPKQYEQIQNDTIKAQAGVRHMSVAPREKTKQELEQFTIDTLGAMVVDMQRQIAMLNRKVSRLMADRQGGE